MIRFRLRSRSVLCLCLAGLATMVFGVSLARAEFGANWMLQGANVTFSTAPSFTISEIEGNSGSLLTQIAGAKVQYLCTGASIFGGKLETEGRLTSGARVTFTGCVTRLNGALSKECAPRSAGLPFGQIETTFLKGLLVLHKGEVIIIIEGKEVKVSYAALVRIEPLVGETLTVIEHGEECSLPESIPIKGKFFARDAKAEEKVELVSHLIVQGPLTRMFAISDTIEHTVTLDGSAIATLTGLSSGMKWSGLPG